MVAGGLAVAVVLLLALFWPFPAAPAEPVNTIGSIGPIDPTGAGDVFAAAFLVALRNAEPLPHATAFATKAAAKAVASDGISWLL